MLLEYKYPRALSVAVTDPNISTEEHATKTTRRPHPLEDYGRKSSEAPVVLLADHKVTKCICYYCKKRLIIALGLYY